MLKFIKVNTTLLLNILTSTKERDVIEFLFLLNTFGGQRITKEQCFERFLEINKYSSLSKKKLSEKFEKCFFAFQQPNQFFVRPLITQHSKNLYKIHSVYTNIKNKTNHHGSFNTLYHAKVTLPVYKNVYTIFKTASLYLLQKLVEYCNDAQFDWKLIDNIFGLSKHFVEKYFTVHAVHREIGPVEARDCQLDRNLFGKKNYRIQTGFTLSIKKEVNVNWDNSAIDPSFFERVLYKLENKDYSNSRVDDVEQITVEHMDKPRKFVLKREITGYTYGLCPTRASAFVKKIAEIHNLGQYKNISNIYSYLRKTTTDTSYKRNAIINSKAIYYARYNNYQYGHSDTI